MDPENINMEDLGARDDDPHAGEESRPEHNEKETSFFDWFDKDVPIKKVEQNPFDENLWGDESWAKNKNADNMELWKVKQQIKITNELKDFFREAFKIEVVMKDGPASRKLIKESEVTISKKTKNVNGLEYKGVKVAFKKGKGYALSTDERFKNTVMDFSNLLKEARLEHSKTAGSVIEDAAGSLPGTSRVNEIRADVINEIQDEITDNVNAVDTTNLTEQEIREFGGLLEKNKVNDLDALDIDVKYWSDKSEAETEPRKKALYKNISDVAKLKGDVIRLTENIKPTSDETLEKINGSVKFDKFKKWAKENMLGLSAIAITVAGILVTIFSAARTVVKGGATALSKFAKAVANIAKKFGPVIAAVGQVIAGVLSFMSGGLKWLAKNLWILAVALTYFIYNEYKTRRTKDKK